MTTSLLTSLQKKVDVLSTHWEEIPESRKDLLSVLADEVRHRLSGELPLRLNFICTHNSRRSQLGQVWATVAALAYDIPAVQTYSGGTEVTAFNLRAVHALERAGFRVEANTGHDPSNPLYLVKFSEQAEPIRCFSKVYDATENPTDDFVAVMTCGEADQNCPVIFGAKRIPLLYDDPKVADGTETESQTYDARSDQIATELLWVFREAARR